MKKLVLLILLVAACGCIGGSSGYNFERGMTDMNAVIVKYGDAPSEPQLLRMRGELFDLYTKVDGMPYSDDIGALKLVIQFRLNFYDARMMQNAAKAEMDQFGFNCSNIDHFTLAQQQYGEFLTYSDAAATNLNDLLTTFPTQAGMANIDANLVSSIKTSSQMTSQSMERARAQVKNACGGA